MELTLPIAIGRIAIRAGTPILLATLGEVYTERSGVLNLGLEGVMAIGAVSGFIAGLRTGNPWAGLLIAAVAGACVSMIHAFLSVSLHVNQVVSGLALTMFGLGLSSVIGREYVGIRGVVIREAPIPVLCDFPVVGRILFRHDPAVYLTVIIALIMWLVLFKTKAGISIRSVGENPTAADALGVNVYLWRYACTILGGFLTGLAGGYLSLCFTPAWTERMTAGRGWIAVALTIFSMWSPLRAVIGAYLFGLAEAAQYALQKYGISAYILGMLPYALTIVVVLVGAEETIRKRIGAPSSLGLPYIRGEK